MQSIYINIYIYYHNLFYIALVFSPACSVYFNTTKIYHQQPSAARLQSYHGFIDITVARTPDHATLGFDLIEKDSNLDWQVILLACQISKHGCLLKNNLINHIQNQEILVQRQQIGWACSSISKNPIDIQIVYCFIYCNDAQCVNPNLLMLFLVPSIPSDLRVSGSYSNIILLRTAWMQEHSGWRWNNLLRGAWTLPCLYFK